MVGIASDKRIMTDKFNSMQVAADSIGESNDCTVKALAAVCYVDYLVAHTALEHAGRKKGRGSSVWDMSSALKEFGFEMETVDQQEFISQYPGNHKNLRSVTTHHMDRFNKVWADGETYLIYTRGHVLAVIDGVNHDWTKGRAMRAVAIKRIKRI